MQNFTLWNAWADPAGTTVTFFATSAGFQRINRGTPKMIGEMLKDLGCPNDQVKDWSVKAFATDYLSDDLDTDDWRVPSLAAWREYLAVKPELGVPALYYARTLDGPGPELQAEDYEALRDTWAAWRERRP